MLKTDYESMLEAGMFFSDKPASFEELMIDISTLESRLNA